MMTARELAYRALVQVERKGSFSNLALKEELKHTAFSQRDRALATALFYGVLQNRLSLDVQLKRFCDLQKTPDAVLRLLRLGAFQILFMDKIPSSAAVNETVSMAKKIAPYGAGCCNSVLRKTAQAGLWLPPRENWEEYCSVRYSFPLWLVRKWKKQFGAEELEPLLEGLSVRQPVTVRVNLNKATPEQVKQELPQLQESPFSDAFYFPGGENLEALPAWQQGRITAMQMSSMTACRAAKVEPGMHVCDMCAAPGGKTAYLAQMAGEKGHVDAWELHAHRAELIRHNLKRLGITNCQVDCRDSAKFREPNREAYDCVLIDAPCSGLGVVSQKPELKWQDPDRMKELLPVQQALLRTGASYVKPGGFLLYSTCTLNRAENETQVEQLMRERTDLQLDPSFGEGAGMRTLLPHRDNTTGFFIARLKKKK